MRILHHFLNDLLLISLMLTANADDYSPRCPNGFNITYDDVHQRYVCYQLKEPETFAEKYRNCIGNFYSPELYQRLNITRKTSKLWIDFIAMYNGGPFIEFKYNKEKLNVTFNVTNTHINNSIELCLITDEKGYIAVDCKEVYERYCFVKPIESHREVCEDGPSFNESIKFYSPHAVCIVKIKLKTKLTWREAKDLCESKSKRLLSRGWIYINSGLFNDSISYPTERMETPKLSATIDDNKEDTELKESYKQEWVVQNNFLERIDNANSSFGEILCESDIMSDVILELNIDGQNQIILAVNGNLDDTDIYCFTDSETYYPTYVNIHRINGTKRYLLSTTDDGYYWCVHLHPKTDLTDSNKILYINQHHRLWHMYAIKIRGNEYNMESIDKFKRYWEDKLEEHFFNQTTYVESRKKTSNEVIKDIFDTNVRVNNNTNSANVTKVISDLKVKRLYLDKRTALLHVNFKHNMIETKPAVLDDLEILSILPVVYCKGKRDNKVFKCVGDFNTGREWQRTTSSKEDQSEDYDDLKDYVEVVNITPTKKKPDRLDNKDNSSIGPVEPIVTETTPVNETTEQNSVEVTTTEKETTVTDVTDDASTIETTTECIETTTDTEGTTIVPTLPSSTDATYRPDELIQMILEDLELILQDDDAHITIGDIREIFEQINILLSIINGDVYIPGQLLQFIAQLSLRISLEESHTAMVVEPNIAMLMADSKQNHPILGMRVTNINPDVFTYESFEFFPEFQEQLPAEMTEAGVMLPPSLGNSSHRIGFVVYRDGRSFTSTDPVATNSRVISVNVKDFNGFQYGEVVNIHTKPMVTDSGRNISRGCGYWKFSDTGPDYWAQDGCTFIKAEDDEALDICFCDHLTHFAEILIPRPLFSQLNEDILKIISVTGCSLSILGLSGVFLTSAVIESWRRNYRNKIWLQMCIAIFIMMICYIIVVFADFNYNTVSCMFVGILLHYSLLASFCWMLVVAIKSYRDLVEIFAIPIRHKFLIPTVFSWGFPAIIIVILSSIPESYSNRFSDINPNSNFCYPSGLALWLAVYLPVCSILLVNCALFVLIVRSIGIAPKSLRYQKAGDKREALNCARVSLVLVVFFGLPWLFGLFAYNIVAAYFFTITATTQGFVLFVFIVLGNRETINLWRLKLRPKNILNNNTSGRSVTLFY